MSKFRVLALEKEKMVEFMFPVDGDEPMRMLFQTMYACGDIDMETIKRQIGWNANSIGRDNVVFLRRCTTAHLRAIIQNVAHLDNFTKSVIESIIEERKDFE